jgi:hypothetical protein
MQLNAATLSHYWWIGNDILSKQKQHGWGAKVIDMLSSDLQKHYGNDSGYSVRNLKYMRQFADEYRDFPFVQVPLAQMQDNPVLQNSLAQFAVFADNQFVQVPLAQILEKTSSVAKRGHGLRNVRAVGDDGFGRRGTKDKTCDGTFAHRHGQNALHFGRADNRASFGGHKGFDAGA